MSELKEISFDAHLAAVVLRALAERADQQPTPVIQATHALFCVAADVLGNAKTWIEQYRTPFDDFTGDDLLAAWERGTPIGRDEFISITTIASLELVAVARLIELRDVRIARCLPPSPSGRSTRMM